MTAVLHAVRSCTPRRGGGYLIVYRVGGCAYSAVSDAPIEPGQRIAVRKVEGSEHPIAVAAGGGHDYR